MMEPTRKLNWAPTYHRDGTVSYWSIYLRQWQRRCDCDIPDRELAADPALRERLATREKSRAG